MEKTFIERRVYNGAPVKRGYRVAGIECVKCDRGDKPVEMSKVQNIAEYSSGCPMHRGGCFGHMCETPTGSILPPHSLSFRSGDIRTQYYIASSKAFERDSTAYINELKETNYGKFGHLRSIMSTPVSGSGRLVCIPHDYEDPRVLFISRNLASKVVFCLPMQHDNGVRGSTYTERSLREGDYVMMERAPSLSKYNNQPMKVMFWDKDCIGIHPKVFSYFHGDYDGDEGHIYALGSPESLAEAKMWKMPLDRNLMAAGEYMEKNFPESYVNSKGEGDLKFIEYTTLSFNEIALAEYHLPIGDMTRNKSGHLKMFKERLDSRPGTTTFLKDSIKGVKDIMRQQVSQGKIGDMTRVSKISAMCFARGREGGTSVVTRKSKVTLNSFTEASTGSPSMRSIMVLCQASQEAALHAHRVGSTETKGMDLLSDMLKGRSEAGGAVPSETLYVLDGIALPEAKRQLRASWCTPSGKHVLCIAADNAGEREVIDHVVGAYSPVVLARVKQGRRKEVCRLGVRVVFNYYGLRLEGDDIEDLVEAMCYGVSLSTLPVTTREGMFNRKLGWMETLMACDYTKLPSLAGSFSGPHSATSATMCANFSKL